MSETSIPLRVALIGLSGYGRVYLELARERRNRGELEIVAATVVNPLEEAANVAELTAHGTEIFPDYPAMLQRWAGALDLCLIPTGIHWHARMTIAALEAGASVLVEKPLAASRAEVEAIRAAERKAQRFVAVGFQDVYQPGSRWLRAELERGVIGEIAAVRFLGAWPRPRRYFTRNNWAGRLSVDAVPVLDSPLHNAFSHFVMLSLFLAGARTATIETAELLRAHAIESFDTGVVQARTELGVSVWCAATHATATKIDPEIVVIGRAGRAHWRFEGEAAWQATNGTAARVRLADITGARRAMFETVIARLRGGDAALCSVEQAGIHTALIEELHRHVPIITLPDTMIAESEDAEAAARTLDVRGLAEALRQSFQRGCSLAEAGFHFPAELAAIPRENR